MEVMMIGSVISKVFSGGGGGIISSSRRLRARFRGFLIRLVLLISAVNFGVISKELNYNHHHHHRGYHDAPYGRTDLSLPSDFYRPTAHSSSSSSSLTNHLYQLARSTTMTYHPKLWEGRGFLDIANFCVLILKVLTLCCICAMLLCLLLLLCPLLPLIISAFLLSLLSGLSIITIIAFFGFRITPPGMPVVDPGEPPQPPPPPGDDDDDFEVITNRSIDLL